MTALRLRDLEVFNTVMKAGKMTEAARLLHVSQPAVSKTIKDMEAGLGIGLFERTGGRLIPTADAEILYREVSAIFNRVSIVDRLVRELRDNQYGNIVIAASPTLAHTILPVAVARFRERHPKVGVSIRCLAVPEVVNAVMRQEADFGLMYNWSADARVAAEAIASIEIGCVMRVDHPLAAQRVVNAEDIPGHQIITYAESTPLGQMAKEAIGYPLDSERAPVVVSFGLTACYLVQEMNGVSLIDPAILARSAFPELTIRPFRPRIATSLEVCIAYGTSYSRAAGSFIEMLKVIGPNYSVAAPPKGALPLRASERPRIS
jgi:DNA-binding transcriptional LysR family regulator